MFGLTYSEYSEFAEMLAENVAQDAIFEHDEISMLTTMRVTNVNNPRFDKFAVTYCSPNDEYSNIRGKLEVMRKMESGKYILIPNTGFVAIYD